MTGAPGPALPLAGIVVVALEQAVAAPFATRQLADLGARVIKVERPGVGDFARGYDRTVHGQASYFVWLNRGKESVELDVKSADLAMTGRGDQIAALLSRHAAATRAEPGCHDFVALRGTEDPDSFVLYERYENREAFDAHMASPHYQGIAVARIRPLLSDRTVEFRQVIE